LEKLLQFGAFLLKHYPVDGDLQAKNMTGISKGGSFLNAGFGSSFFDFFYKIP
jgi:hypothetical protein